MSWQEALARAAADLLEGEWADRYLVSDAAGRQLWPSQRLGIAQALWITERVGSVLVADATGSGKTRMGAHLVRAVHDRLWSTGRVRRGGTVLVCPPPVQATWFEEAVKCGLNIATVSHGLLSRGTTDGLRPEAEAVRSAQILAVDESHNFLSPGTNRSQQVRSSVADSVLLFTATPINRDRVGSAATRRAARRRRLRRPDAGGARSAGSSPGNSRHDDRSRERQPAATRSPSSR